MNKLFATALLIAITIGAYAYFGPKSGREVGDPILSATPEASGNVSATASTSALVLVDGTYGLVASSSHMEWEGRKTLIINYTDHGTIKLKEGTTTVKNGAVVSGSVTVDMATIQTLSTGRGDGESMQEKHIKSADFFDVEKYPTAKFVFGKLEPASASGEFTLSGTLTIKAETKPVAFPVTLSAHGDTLTMKASAVLDRTLWGIKYASGKFFQGLGDKVIDDNFTVSFTAVGKLSK